MARIAADNLVPFRAVRELEKHGHKVVVWAGDAPDHVWLEEAEEEGALLVISNDDEVLSRARIWGMLTVSAPSGIGGKELATYLVREVNRVLHHQPRKIFGPKGK